MMSLTRFELVSRRSFDFASPSPQVFHGSAYILAASVFFLAGIWNSAEVQDLGYLIGGAILVVSCAIFWLGMFLLNYRVELGADAGRTGEHE